MSKTVSIVVRSDIYNCVECGDVLTSVTVSIVVTYITVLIGVTSDIYNCVNCDGV